MSASIFADYTAFHTIVLKRVPLKRNRTKALKIIL